MGAFFHKFFQTFFQQIPNGVCLVFAIGALVSTVFMLAKRHHRGKLFVILWAAFLFMGLWRCAKGIISIRYASIMIFPMVIATAFGCRRGEAWWRLLCRYFRCLPSWFGRVIALGCLIGCTGGALVIAHYKLNIQSRAFTTICRTVSDYRKLYPDLRVLVKHNDTERFTYHTQVPCIPLEDNQREFFAQGLNGITDPDGHFLLVVMERHLKGLEPRRDELRPGAKLSRVRAKRYRQSKRKNLDIYFYENPLSFSRIAAVSPAPPASPDDLLGPGAFGPSRSAAAFRSRPVPGGGGFRFTFVVSAEAVSGKAAAVEVRTVRRQGNGEVPTLQLRCPVKEKGIYRGVVTFRTPPGPFAICLDGLGTTVRLEQFRLTRAE